MKYIIHSLFSDEVQQYQKSIVSHIAKETGLEKTLKQNLSAHFTLKYWFERSSIEELRKLFNEFCLLHAPSPLRVGEVSHFNKDVLFINIHLSEQAKFIFEQFIKELKKLKWMPWDALGCL